MNEWFDAEAHVDRALELFERGRWAEAEAELRKALAMNPDQAEWHYNLGLTLEAAGRDADAYLSFLRATELLSDEVQPALSTALTAARLGRLDESNRWLEKVLKLNATNEVAHATLIDNLTRAGAYEEAHTAFYVAVNALDERSAPCYAAIAETLLREGNYPRAEWCLKEALRISPNIPRVRAQLGRVFAATGRPHRALQMFLRELRDDPGNIDALLDYGDLLYETGRLPEAGEKFRRVLELQPAHAEAHMRLGEIALAMGRHEQAHLEFELVLKLDPSYPDVRTFLAETLMRRNRRSEARTVLASEVERLDAMAFGDDGEVRAFDGENDSPDARSEGHVADLSRLGRALLDAEMASEAASVLERAIAEGDDEASTLRNLALAHFQSGDRRRGVACSRRALRADPKCVESIHNLALAALQEGWLRVASGWIRRGLMLAPNDEGLRRLRMRLWFDSLRHFIGRSIESLRSRRA